jgi:hypothetical protein
VRLWVMQIAINYAGCIHSAKRLQRLHEHAERVTADQQHDDAGFNLLFKKQKIGTCLCCNYNHWQSG